MYKLLAFIIIILLIQSCQIKNGGADVENNKIEEKIVPDLPQENIEAFDLDQHLVNYQHLKDSITRYKGKIKNKKDLNQAEKIEIAEAYISQILIDSIFRYWLETTWDFNGYTEKPREGEIACGYFVTTTLRDVGVNLNRYKIAQKAAAEIISDLCEPTTIKRLKSFDRLEVYLKSITDNDIQIVGLDNHVGFIFKRENRNYFAHSNYINRKGVEIELAEKSIALKNSNIYVIGSFSKNIKITKKWLN